MVLISRRETYSAGVGARLDMFNAGCADQCDVLTRAARCLGTEAPLSLECPSASVPSGLPEVVCVPGGWWSVMPGRVGSAGSTGGLTPLDRERGWRPVALDNMLRGRSGFPSTTGGGVNAVLVVWVVRGAVGTPPFSPSRGTQG